MHANKGPGQKVPAKVGLCHEGQISTYFAIYPYFDYAAIEWLCRASLVNA